MICNNAPIKGSYVPYVRHYLTFVQNGKHMETIKKWFTPALALITALLYMLFRRQVAKTTDAENALLQQEAASNTAKAKQAEALSTKENANAQDAYNELRKSRPDLFPPSES